MLLLNIIKQQQKALMLFFGGKVANPIIQHRYYPLNYSTGCMTVRLSRAVIALSLLTVALASALLAT